jgi:hypothetical protein
MGPLGGYETHIRLQLLNDIMNQQSNVLKEFNDIHIPTQLLKPDKNVKVPEYDYLSEGIDPAKLLKKRPKQ